MVLPPHANSTNISDVCMDFCHFLSLLKICALTYWINIIHIVDLSMWRTYVCHTLPFIQIFECNKHFAHMKRYLHFHVRGFTTVHRLHAECNSIMQCSHIFVCYLSQMNLDRDSLDGTLREQINTDCWSFKPDIQLILLCELNSRIYSSSTICNANKCLCSTRINNVGPITTMCLFYVFTFVSDRVCRWRR